MKTTTLHLLSILLLGILLIPNKIYAVTLNEDSTICLEIKGKLININSKTSDSYKVELIYYNTVVTSETISLSKSFKYNLKRDAIYSIRISKEGYITKLISIYTKLPKDIEDVYRLDFETELIEEHKSKKLNADALDFPITIIYYDDKADSFYFNEEYTSNIKRCIYDIKVIRKKI